MLAANPPCHLDVVAVAVDHLQRAAAAASIEFERFAVGKEPAALSTLGNCGNRCKLVASSAIGLIRKPLVVEQVSVGATAWAHTLKVVVSKITHTVEGLHIVPAFFGATSTI